MTLREHLESAWQATGKMPARLADAPGLPDECADLWSVFIALHGCRGSTGFGPARITFTDLDAYQRTTGETLLPWEVRAIRAADGAYMAVQAEARD